MTYRSLVLFFAACFVSSTGCAAAAVPRAEGGSPPIAAPPNIVFILADDLGLRDLSCTGSDYHQTPNLDRLAAQGMLFTDAYANCANCAPTRAALMSGMYAPRTGVYTVNSSERGPAAQRVLVPTPNTTTLAPEIVTLAESLREAGYTTCHVGKWHLGAGNTGPLAQGFDLNIAGNHRGHPPSYHSPYNNPALDDGPEGEYLTDRLTDEAIAFMRDNAHGPFFLYLPYYTVHTPLQPREDLLAEAQSREPGELHSHPRYAAMVGALDENVGRLLHALEQLGLDDNTLVVFTSDNGGMSPQTDMAPLRGSKGMVYEGGVRVPLIVCWPGVVDPSSRCDEPVITLDFYPTLVDAARGTMPDSQPADGESLLPLFRDARATLGREALYWHFPAYLHGYRGMQEESHRASWRATPCSVVRAGDWKLIRDYETNTDTLYHLDRDLGETQDLAQRHPDKRDELAALLDAWLEELDAPIPTEPNPDYRGD
ncbi:sulfatase [Phycisphaeraceae bacterium D3-23]